VDAQFRGENDAQLAGLAYLVNLLCRQSYRRMALAGGAAAFTVHVCDIIGGSSDKQMFGIYAAGCIAAVANEHAVRDWANE